MLQFLRTSITGRVTAFFCLLFLGLLGFGQFIMAATLTSVIDRPTSHVISAAANHKFTLVLTDAWAEGETLTLVFPSSFATETITEDDVDLSDDGVDLTTAASCAGAEQASVNMSSDTLTLTICAGDGGAIASASEVVIEIGTNAASSGLGTNRITNPATAGTYFLAIQGTSGNDGSVLLPIITSNDSGVSVVVSAVSGGGDSGGGAGDGGSVPPPPVRADEPVDEIIVDEIIQDPPDEVITLPPDPDPTKPPVTDDAPEDLSNEPLLTPDSPVVTPSDPFNPNEDSGEDGPVVPVEEQEKIELEVFLTRGSDASLVIGQGDFLLPGEEVGVSVRVVFQDEDKDEVSNVRLMVGELVYVLEQVGDYEYSGVFLAPWKAINSRVIISLADGSEIFQVLPLNISTGDLVSDDEGVSVTEPIDDEKPVVLAVGSLASIFDNPQVEQAARVTLPLLIAMTTASVAILLSTFSLLAYLQYLATSPLLIFGRKKRNNFGVVYNAVTKVGIDLAIVRLYRLSDNKLVKTAVSDAVGRYFMFYGEPGDYKMVVTKPGFVFPSVYTEGDSNQRYSDIYTKQVIRIKDKEALISANIPLDPADVPLLHTERRLQWRRWLGFIQRLLAPLGLIFALISLFVLPSILTVGVFLLQLLLLLFSVRLAWPKRPRGWGFVKDAKGSKPLGNVVVRLFEPRYNKLVESTLTDSKGRYSFLVGANSYYMSFTKKGFTEKIVKDLDFTKQVEPAPLTANVSLDSSA